MNKHLVNVFIFAVGAAVGSAVTYKLIGDKLKAKYEQLAADEIEAIREYYLGKTQEEETIPEEAPEDHGVSDDIRAYASIMEKNRYTNSDESERTVDEVERPYVIGADEYGEYADYEMENLVYYADGTLADMADNVVDDIEELVGTEFIAVFDRGEDTVFVRNDRKMVDYEIQYDDREFADVLEEYPPDTGNR